MTTTMVNREVFDVHYEVSFMYLSGPFVAYNSTGQDVLEYKPVEGRLIEQFSTDGEALHFIQRNRAKYKGLGYYNFKIETIYNLK